MNKYFIYTFIFLLLAGCGLGKKEVVQDDPNAIILFEKSKPIEQELNVGLNIQLNSLTQGEPFLTNYSNNSGNINFGKNFEKTNSYKFKAIEEFNFTQPELLFTDDKGIIFFDGKGNIFKINEDLKEIWKVNHYTKKERKLNPIIYFAQAGQNIILMDTLSKVYSINLNDGKLNWTLDSQSGFNSNVKIAKDQAIAVDFNNVIRAFSINDGKELWNFETENPFIKSQKKLSLAIKGEAVFFINSIGDITALNLNDGSLVWQTPTQSNVIYQDAFTLESSDLVFTNDTIYYSNNKNEIFAIDARNGVVRWQQTVNSSLRPTIIDNLVFLVSEEGFLFVIDDQTGNVIRITNILKNIENKKKQIKPTGFIIARSKLYVSLNNGRLIIINALNGVEEKILKLDNSKISRANVFNGNLYVLKSNAILKSN